MIDLCFYLYQKSFPLYPFALFVCLQYMQLNTQCIYKNTTFHNLIVPELRCSYLYPVRYSFIIFEQIILEFFDSIWWSELIENGVFIFEIILLLIWEIFKFLLRNWWCHQCFHIGRQMTKCGISLEMLSDALQSWPLLIYSKRGIKWPSLCNCQQFFFQIKFVKNWWFHFFVRTEHCLLSTSWFGDLRQHGL